MRIHCWRTFCNSYLTVTQKSLFCCTIDCTTFNLLCNCLFRTKHCLMLRIYPVLRIIKILVLHRLTSKLTSRHVQTYFLHPHLNPNSHPNWYPNIYLTSRRTFSLTSWLMSRLKSKPYPSSLLNFFAKHSKVWQHVASKPIRTQECGPKKQDKPKTQPLLVKHLLSWRREPWVSHPVHVKMPVSDLSLSWSKDLLNSPDR